MMAGGWPKPAPRCSSEAEDIAAGRPNAIPGENILTPTVADIGLTSKDMFAARQIRDAEEA
jgi:hypothetical protein